MSYLWVFPDIRITVESKYIDIQKSTYDKNSKLHSSNLVLNYFMRSILETRIHCTENFLSLKLPLLPQLNHGNIVAK